MYSRRTTATLASVAADRTLSYSAVLQPTYAVKTILIFNIDAATPNHRAGVVVMQRVLVKAAPAFSAPQLTFGASSVTFAAARLFQSIDSQPALGAASGDVWHILTPPPGFAEANAWDVCHSLMQPGAWRRR